MKLKDCPECAAENADDAIRCSNCGWPLNRRRMRKSCSGGGEKWSGFRIVFGLVLIAFVIALLKSWAE